GVRFGAFNIFIPMLLKPAASDLVLLLWALHHGTRHGIDPDALPEPPRQGLTSVTADPELPESFYRAAGYHHCGQRVVRIDMLERLADMIRPLVSWRPDNGKASEQIKRADKVKKENKPEEQAKASEQNKAKDSAGAVEAPEGATGNGGFRVTPDMTSIIGCSGEDFASVLKVLGFRRERKPLTAARQAELATLSAAEKNGEQTATATAEEAGDAAIQNCEAMDEIWRPRRKAARDGARKGRGRTAHTARGKAKDTAKAPAKAKRVHKPKPRVSIDPDSPFAALKDLKRDLQQRVKDPS
ncbi:MAG: hypothetical protein ACE5FM_09745, partial [Methyloligellaceae bacterium]